APPGPCRVGRAARPNPARPAAAGTARTRRACSPRRGRSAPAVSRAGKATWAGASEVLAQVHARVQRGDLLGVAIEGQGTDAVAEQAEAVAGDPPLGGLAPARMVDVGIDVAVVAVFIARRHVPGRARLVFGELDPHDRLDPLEAVFPRHDQA